MLWNLMQEKPTDFVEKFIFQHPISNKLLEQASHMAGGMNRKGTMLIQCGLKS